MKQYLSNLSETLMRASENGELIERIESAIHQITDSLKLGRPLLVCGNGGSAADAMHITGELVGRFNHNRAALNAVCLNTNSVVLTAWSNDIDFESVFSRQVEAHGQKGGVLWALSTSGNSKNVVAAVRQASFQGLLTVGMTGDSGGELRGLVDILIDVPGTEAPEIQNLHVPIYHWMCSEIERRLLGTFA
jgi:D-sedoheptulose 7-phosphate isomerase